MKRIAFSAAVAALSFTATNLIADDNVETIVVTGTRIPTNLSESLSAVTVLQRADIERYQAADLFELMSRVPSVSFTRNGGRGSSTSMSLRGNQSDHTLFLIDGARIGSATSGGAALASINLATVERIEVIRGPKSNLYGADAIGGVVNVITRKTDASRLVTLESRFGSNNTRESTVLMGANGDKYSLTAVFNQLDTDGVDSTATVADFNGDDDSFSKDSFAINYQLQLNDQIVWKVTYNQNDTKADYDSACNNKSPYQPVACDIYSDGNVNALVTSIEMNISEQWQTSLQVGRSYDEGLELARNIDIDTTYSGGKFNTKKSEATWVNHLFLSDHNTLTLGADYLRDEVSSSTTYDEASRDNHAVFVQYQTLLGAVDANIGVRSDDNEQFGSHTTVSVLAGLDLSDNLRLIGSYGEGFKAPTFNDLYFPGFSNPGLLPEESQNIEVGLNGDFGDMSVTAAYFVNEVDNMILYVGAPDYTQNIDKAEISGIEFNVATELAGWDFSLSGSIIDPENKSGELSGKQLRRRPEQSMSLDGHYGSDNWQVGFTLRSESHRYDDADNTIKLGGYTTSAIRASYRINNEWVVKAKVDNLTDKDYVTATSSSLGDYLSVGREIIFTIAYTPSL